MATGTDSGTVMVMGPMQPRVAKTLTQGQSAPKQAWLDPKPYTQIVSHIVKTTLVLPDDLLMEAKTLAVRRKTTLKALIEAALRREIRSSMEPENPDPSRFEVGPFGILRIRKASGSPSTTVDQVRAVQEVLENEELERMTHPKQS